MNDPNTALVVAATANKPGKVWCFVAVPNPYVRAHSVDVDTILAIATLGESGYELISVCATYDEIINRADALNKMLPWYDSCVAIVGDTMQRSKARQEAEDRARRFVVTMTADKPLSDEARHSVTRAIEDLLDNLRGPDGEWFDVEVE